MRTFPILLVVVMALHSAPGAEATAAASETAKAPAKEQVAPPKELPALLKTAKEAKDAAERQAALKVLRESRMSPVPAEVSARFFNSAMLDTSADVRKEAALAVKDLGDLQAKKFLANAVLHPKIEAKIRDQGNEALRLIDDPIIVGAFVALVTEELRVGSAFEVTAPQIIYITSGANTNQALGQFNLPIELPNIELRSVQTSVAFYALSALRTISRRDLGNDPVAWAGWFQDWKQIRDVRLAQEAKP